MIIHRTVLKPETRKVVVDFVNERLGFINKTVKGERDYGNRSYPGSEMRVVTNVLGFVIEHYFYHDTKVTDNVNKLKRAIKLMSEDDKKVELNRICGRCFTTINDFVFDTSPIRVGEVLSGMEFVVADMLVNIMEFGIKNYLSLVANDDVNIPAADFAQVDEELDGYRWIVVNSYKTPFLLEKEGIKGLSAPKIRAFYAPLEASARAEGGTGMKTVDMEGVDDFDEFMRMLGLR